MIMPWPALRVVALLLDEAVHQVGALVNQVIVDQDLEFVPWVVLEVPIPVHAHQDILAVPEVELGQDHLDRHVVVELVVVVH